VTDEARRAEEWFNERARLCEGVEADLDSLGRLLATAVTQAVEEAQLPPVRKLISDLEKQIAEVDTINKLSAKVTEQAEEIARLKRNLAYHEARLPEARRASNEQVRRLGFLPAEEIVWVNKECNGRALQDVWRDAGCRRDPAEILPAIIDALTQEGISAWSGDATSIVEQIVRVQYDRAERAERTERERVRDNLMDIADALGCAKHPPIGHVERAKEIVREMLTTSPEAGRREPAL
jgi:uncharacterized coiled-coil protein SlyX